MAATTTPLMNLLLNNLRKDFSNIKFAESGNFMWSPDDNTVFYNASVSDPPLLLHELSHALLDHKSYLKDVELVSMEAAAWQKAQELALNYGVKISEDDINQHLDTYRDWLHARSSCPSCSAIGYQSGSRQYTCPGCTTKWRVNEAKVCELRRFKI